MAMYKPKNWTDADERELDGVMKKNKSSNVDEALDALHKTIELLNKRDGVVTPTQDNEIDNEKDIEALELRIKKLMSSENCEKKHTCGK